MQNKYVRYCFHRPTLLPEEAILHTLPPVRQASLTCAHSYSFCWPLPVNVLITQRRLIFSWRILTFLWMEIDLWFPGHQPGADADVVTAISLHKSFWGKCLEIQSWNPTRKLSFWFSPKLTLRLFNKEPEKLAVLFPVEIAKGA